MKNLFVSAAVLCFSAMTMAQSYSDVSLNLEGKFLKRSVGVARGVKDDKACKARSGVLNGDKCIITKAKTSVSIKTLDSSSYIVKITKKQTGKKAEMRDLIAVKRNSVQLISTDGSCDIIVGFQNKHTLSIFTEGECNGENATIGVNNVTRLVEAKKK